MFWPFATSVEELMIYMGRADLLYYSNERYKDQPDQPEIPSDTKGLQASVGPSLE